MQESKETRQNDGFGHEVENEKVREPHKIKMDEIYVMNTSKKGRTAVPLNKVVADPLLGPMTNDELVLWRERHRKD